MSEDKKTGIFWVFALAMLAVGLYFSWESPIQLDDARKSLVNTVLFKSFKDPLSAASVKIVTLDEGQGSFKNFEVRRNSESGAWTITSHKGYPADAIEQMQNAANALIDVKIQDQIEADPSKHAEYGVVEPIESEYTLGDEGIGRLVTFKDKDQKTIASLILGDRVKDQPGKMYVRVPRQDPVYVVTLDDRPLNPNFQSWIETDLLQLSSINIQRVNIRDYSTVPNTEKQRFVTSRNFDATLVRDGSVWGTQEIRDYDPENEFSEGEAAEFEDNAKPKSAPLGNMLNALDDMRIVNVVRKPKDVSEKLLSDKSLLSDSAVMNAIAQLGFYPKTVDGKTELLSANGELILGMDDGVEYLLRFGNVASVSDQNSDSQNQSGVNRYLFVVARVDNSFFPPPELKPLPQSLEEAEADEETTADLSEEEKLEYLEGLQEKVRKENQRKIDERKDQMKVATRRARDLSARFADWYYVISEDTFSKLRIKRDDLLE